MVLIKRTKYLENARVTGFDVRTESFFKIQAVTLILHIHNLIIKDKINILNWTVELKNTHISGAPFVKGF